MARIMVTLHEDPKAYLT